MLARLALLCLVVLAPCQGVRAGDAPPPADTTSAGDSAAAVEIAVKGLESDLETAVKSGLTLAQYAECKVSDAQLKRLVNVGEQEIRATLEAWGYYDGKVSSRVDRKPGGAFLVGFEVAPGAPTVVTASEVSVSGDAARDPNVARALAAFRPRIAERFDHAQYEASKAAIETALADNGYLGAKLGAHRVEIRAADRSARIELAWDGGPRYTFGTTTFSGGQFPPEFLDRFVPWKAGDAYASSQVLDFQRRLVGADYFGTVTVQPHPEKAVERAVPIEVTLTPAKRTIYSAALYASTDRGAGVELGLQRRWLNSLGHKGQADVDIAQRLQALELSYRIPLPGQRRRVLSFAGTYRDETTESSVSQTEKLAINVSRKWGNFTNVYGLQFLAGDFEIGSERGNSSLTFLEGALSWATSDQPTFARRGFSYTLSARYTPVEDWTDTRFGSLRLDTKWLQALGERTRLILRAEAGKIDAGDFDLLPPELRFFAGGDRSIRGFGFEEIGSRNAAGDVIGGDQLVEGGVELEYYWRKNLGAAVFVDAGDAWLGSDFSLHVGAGVGVRWKSPVGVMRLDFAYPVEAIDASGWQIHFSLGPDF
jgi:translocation and assembly module TamA